ncbi:DUF2513 domain-containing protein [Rhodobacteraceae bacterium M382]|nr:DUF2513 domain-containing protein [Rhodobacteraceae bacterium M382]
MRDLDRIREIIIEASETPSEYDDGLVEFGDRMLPGDEYQLYLMADAGLIEGRACKNGIFFITNRGADFYGAILNEGVWEKTKAGASQVGGMTLGMVKDLAVAYIKKEAAEKLGISF